MYRDSADVAMKMKGFRNAMLNPKDPTITVHDRVASLAEAIEVLARELAEIKSNARGTGYEKLKG